MVFSINIACGAMGVEDDMLHEQGAMSSFLTVKFILADRAISENGRKFLTWRTSRKYFLAASSVSLFFGAILVPANREPPSTYSKTIRIFLLAGSSALKLC